MKSGGPYSVFLSLARDEEGDQAALVLLKYTYRFDGRGGLFPAEPEPLYNHPVLEGFLKPGCDFWSFKLLTDVVVQGKAHAPAGRRVREMEVSVRIGGFSKTVKVFGRRRVSYPRKGVLPKFSEPEPFESIDLTYENAYGGIDWRVRPEDEDSPVTQYRLLTDHPGFYPRNPFGRGYVVMPDHEDVDGMELPNLEKPDDLLTPERLIVGDPHLWYRQPLPWCFDWLRAHVYPRCAFFGGADAWFPAPYDELPEVKLGYLPKGYRELFGDKLFETGPDPRFFNEASLGMALPLKGDETIILEGMSPEGTVALTLPGLPAPIRIFVEGKEMKTRIRLHTVLVKAEEKKVSLLWGALAKTPRPFLPGIHKEIPIECRIGNDPPIPYDAPPTILDKLKEGMQKREGETKIPQIIPFPWEGR